MPNLFSLLSFFPINCLTHLIQVVTSIYQESLLVAKDNGHLFYSHSLPLWNTLCSAMYV